jgi:hypothetical protein
MNAESPQDRQPPGNRSFWPWMLGLGCLLVILIAIVMPRQEGEPSSGATPAAAPGAAAPTERGSAQGRLRPFVRAGDVSGPTAQGIVAGKVSQFARGRWEIVQAIARHFKVDVPVEVDRFFDAMEAGRQEEADALFKAMSEEHNSTNAAPGLKQLWPAVMETYGIAEVAHDWPAQKLLEYGNAVLGSLRPDMVYVGGTDAGRFIPTLLSETGGGDPHVILTQNALADATYLDYLRFLYGDRMAMLTSEDSQRAFNDYIADATKRLQHDEQCPDEPRQIRPGEDVHRTDGRVQVGGQVAVCYIDELLLQMLMRKNPDAAFALEESFPFRSTYPGATTLGPVMELRSTDPQAALTGERAAQALDYWRTTAQELLSDPETPQGSTVRDAYVKMMLAQANLFLDRNYAAQAEEAMRLATDLSPAGPEAVFKYVDLLLNQQRFADARQVAETAARLDPGNQQFGNLVQALNRRR